MAFLTRERQELAPVSTEEVDVGPPASAVEVFLADHDQVLNDSRRTWGKFGAILQTFEDKQLATDLAGHYEAYPSTLRGFDQSEQNALRNSIMRQVDRLPAKLATYYLTFASYVAEKDNAGIRDFVSLGSNFATVDSHVRSGMGYMAHHPKYSNLNRLSMDAYSDGRKLRTLVTKDLVITAQHSPEIFQELTATLQTEPNNPTLRELQRACAVDWHHPNKSSSILHRYVDSLGQDPDSMLDKFYSAVHEKGSQSEQLRRIYDLASFAIIASKELCLDDYPDIAEILAVTRQHWKDFGIDQEYAAFQKAAISSLSRQIEGFAGPLQGVRGSIRFPRTEADYQIAKAQLSGFFNPNSPRVKRTQAEVRRGVLARQVPSSQRMLSEIEALKPEYRPGLLKHVSKRECILVTNNFDVSKIDGTPNDPLFQEELAEIIGLLVEDPYREGTVQMHRDTSYRVDGKLYRGRRARADEIREAKAKSKRIRKHRIYYTITADNTVAIDEVCTKERSTSKY